MTTIRPLTILLITLALCACILPAGAILQSFTFRGYVTSTDPVTGNLSLLATHQWRCSYENDSITCGWKAITPQPISGTVPSETTFSLIRSGQVVEASSLGNPGGHWTGIGVLAPVYEEQGYLATAIVGDIDSLPAPLVAGYSVTTETEPDCETCTGSTCAAILARITVSRNGEIVGTATLSPADTYQYSDEEDHSGVDVAFISGQASAALCPNASPFMTGPQPISIFTVSVTPPSEGVSSFPGTENGSIPLQSVPSALSSLPGYADALAAAKGTTSGTTPSGSLKRLPGYQDALDKWREMPGAKVYTGTIQRAYSSYPCYTLTYSDSYQNYVVYLPADEITPAVSGNALPNPIPNPVALDYVGPIDYYHYTLDFRYQGVTYSAHWYTSCPQKNPYIWGDANHCNIPLEDRYFGTVYIYSWDTAKDDWTKTPAEGVLVTIYAKDCDPPCGTGEIREVGSTHTNSDGYWRKTTGQTYDGEGYATYYLAGYPPAQDDLDNAPFCVED